MELQVEGSRSTSDNWIVARHIPIQNLPAITEQEEQVAEKLSISLEDHRRSKYAVELTKRELEIRSSTVGELVQKWLSDHGLSATVTGVLLKTFDGRFRIDVETGGRTQCVFLTEDLMEDVLDSGSPESFQSFDRVLTFNLITSKPARAS